MRIFVIRDDTDLTPIREVAARPGLAEKLAAANPHLDFRRLKPGAVVLVPDEVQDTVAEEMAEAAPGAASPFGASGSIAGDAIGSFAEFAAQALAGSARRVKAGADRAAADAEALAAALKSKAAREAIDRDAALKAQAETALTRAKDDAKAAQAAVRQFDAQADAAREALKALQALATPGAEKGGGQRKPRR
jgi:hypothetical protein